MKSNTCILAPFPWGRDVTFTGVRGLRQASVSDYLFHLINPLLMKDIHQLYRRKVDERSVCSPHYYQMFVVTAHL